MSLEWRPPLEARGRRPRGKGENVNRKNTTRSQSCKRSAEWLAKANATMDPQTPRVQKAKWTPDLRVLLFHCWRMNPISMHFRTRTRKAESRNVIIN